MGIIGNGGGGGGTLQVKSGAQLLLSAPQSINNATTTSITWTSAAFDTGTYTNIASHPTRLTAPVTGLYILTGYGEFAGNATGVRSAVLLKNGATTFEVTNFNNQGAGSTASVFISCLVQMTAADFIEFQVAQNSGGALNFNGTNAVYSISYLGT